MKLKIADFTLFGLVSFLAGSLSIFSQSPWNYIVVLLVSFPILYYLLDKGNSDSSFFIKFIKFSYFGSLFLYGYFFFGLLWVSSAFSYQEELESLKFISIFGLPLLLTIISIPGWFFTAFFWGSRLQSCVAISFGLVIGEYSRSIIFTGFPWNLFGHVLSFDDRALQIISIIGIHAATFFIIIFSLTPILLFRKKTFIFGLISAMVIPFMIFYGFLRIPDNVNFSKKDFLLVQPNISQDMKMGNDNLQPLLDKFINLSSQRPIADLVIWPESALPIMLSDNKVIRKHIMNSISGDSSLLTGNIRIDEKGLYRNSSFLINEDSKIISAYDKIHLVPFGEYLPFSKFINNLKFLRAVTSDDGFSRGLSYEPIQTPIGLARVLICYEIIFSREIMQSKQRPDLLINITNDAWFDNFSGPYQHFDNAKFRAIEYGLPVLRSANTGISAVIDPYGRVLEKINLGQEGSIYSFLPKKIPETFFSKFGDFTLLILFIICSLLFRKNLMREYFYGK